MESLGIEASNNKKSLKENRISKMTMAIVGVFISCNSVPILFYIAYLVKGEISFNVYMLVIIGHLLVVINSSANPIIYGIFIQKFRNC